MAETFSIDTHEPLPESTGDAERVCRDFFDEAWARGNTERLGHLLTDDFVHNAPPGYTADRDGYIQMVRDFHHGIPDMSAELVDIVAQGDKVASRWIAEGHQNNELLGIPPTGKKIRVEGLTIAKVRDGRVSEEFTVQDMAAALLQLGVTDLSVLAPP